MTFEFQDSIVKVLESGPHVIDGKQVGSLLSTVKPPDKGHILFYL